MDRETQLEDKEVVAIGSLSADEGARLTVAWSHLGRGRSLFDQKTTQGDQERKYGHMDSQHRTSLQVVPTSSVHLDAATSAAYRTRSYGGIAPRNILTEAEVFSLYCGCRDSDEGENSDGCKEHGGYRGRARLAGQGGGGFRVEQKQWSTVRAEWRAAEVASTVLAMEPVVANERDCRCEEGNPGNPSCTVLNV